MMWRIIGSLWLLFISGFTATILLSQEQFVQFTYYDQLSWSGDGNQLAFRCILLDESRPEQMNTNVLIKDLTRDRLICLNPQPERFVVSGDKKYLLFSSSYGLYLVSLKEENRAVQLYFRNPAANWIFQDFGFLKDPVKIFFDRYDYLTTKTSHEEYQIQLPKFSLQFIDWVAAKKINRKSPSSRFDLPVDEINSGRQPGIKIKDMVIEFLPDSKSDEPGNFKLVYQPSRKNPAHSVLLERCRPRLLSVNPDSTEIVVAVFTEGNHRTYRLPVSATNLIPIENKRYFSVSWLDIKRYICVTEDGLFLRNIDLSLNEQINRWQFPEWCRGINLDLPKFELQVGFESEKSRAEQLIARLQQSGVPARMKYVKDQSQAGYRIRVGGFSTRAQAQSSGEQLKNKGFNFWIDKLTDGYDFFNALRPDEQRSFGEKTAIIQYRRDGYLRSRILVSDPNGKRRIIVDEMNNIPGWAPW